MNTIVENLENLENLANIDENVKNKKWNNHTIVLILSLSISIQYKPRKHREHAITNIYSTMEAS